MNLWPNLIILLVLFNGLEYSVSESYIDYFYCNDSSEAKSKNFAVCVAQIYAIRLWGLWGRGSGTPEQMCCFNTDGFCANIQFVNL